MQLTMDTFRGVCDKFYVRADIFESQFCAAPNSINN